MAIYKTFDDLDMLRLLEGDPVPVPSPKNLALLTEPSLKFWITITLLPVTDLLLIIDIT